MKAPVVGWFSIHGEQRPNEITVSNLFPDPTAPPKSALAPAPRGTIWPESLAETLNEFRVSSEEIDALSVRLFILGNVPSG